MEVLSQLDIALDQNFIDNNIHQSLEALIEEEARVLSGYRASLLKLKAESLEVRESKNSKH